MSIVTRHMSFLTLHCTVKMSSGYGFPRLGFGMLNNNNLAPAIHAALKTGYRYIDGAQFYENEKQIGEALRGADVPRSKIFVTSKLMQGRSAMTPLRPMWMRPSRSSGSTTSTCTLSMSPWLVRRDGCQSSRLSPTPRRPARSAPSVSPTSKLHFIVCVIRLCSHLAA
jgi:hypothetical protein